MTPDTPEQIESPTTPSATHARPSAFAQGTGVLLQTVGVVLFLTSSCLCSISGLWDPVMTRSETLRALGNMSAAHRGGHLNPVQEPGKTGMMVTTVSTTVGGLAMATFGLGMQALKPRAAWVAVTVLGVVTITLVAAGWDVWHGHVPLLYRLWHTAATVVCLLMAGLSYTALRQVRAGPRPTDPATDQPH